MLWGMSQILAEDTVEELAEDEVVTSCSPVEDSRAVELNDGLQEQRMARSAVNDALKDVIATVTYAMTM